MVGSWQRRQEAGGLNEGQKRRIMRKEYQRLFKKFRNGRFHGPRRIMESRWRKGAAG